MKFKATALLLSAGLVLAACGNDDADDKAATDDDNVKTETKTDKSTDTTKDDSDDKATNTTDTTDKNLVTVKDIQTKPDKAIELAQKEYDGELKGVSYEYEHGEWTYKVTQVKGNEEAETLISDKDQKVLDTKKEQEDEDQARKSFKYNDAKPFDEAIEKAIKEAGDGKVREWSLSLDDGQLKYDVDVVKDNQKHEVSLDAKSLNVLKNEVDS